MNKVSIVQGLNFSFITVGFCLLGFTRSRRPRNLKFFGNSDTMYDTAELFIGRRIMELEEKSCRPSKETELDLAGFLLP